MAKLSRTPTMNIMPNAVRVGTRVSMFLVVVTFDGPRMLALCVVALGMVRPSGTLPTMSPLLPTRYKSSIPNNATCASSPFIAVIII